MATFKSSLYKIQDQDSTLAPGVKAEIGDLNGRKRVMAFSVAPAAVLVTNDVLLFGKLPPGARVVEMHVYVPTGGGTGTFELGWGASADGSVAADQDGFSGSQDISGGAKDYKLTGDVPGFMKKFAQAVDVKLTVTADTTDPIAAVTGSLEYVID